MKKVTALFKSFGLKIPTVVGQSDEAVAFRDDLVGRSAAVVAIADADGAAAAAGMARELVTYEKSVKEFGLEARRPVNDFVALVKRTEDEHLAKVSAELKRVKGLIAGWDERERARVAEESRKAEAALAKLAAEQAEKQRLADEALRKAQESGSAKDVRAAEKLAQKAEAADEKLMTALRAPEAEAVKPAGTSARKELCFEVTDIDALVRARPDLCKVEAKASAIKAVCDPARPVPGLRLWWETRVSVSR